MNKKIVVHNPNNLPTILYSRLEDLQGNFKVTDKDKINKLAQSIINNGVFVPKFVWIDNGIHYIIDGHQTVKALCQLETEGYEIPKIPYVEVKAKDKTDAAKKLLQINSKYGEINFETDFLERFDIEDTYIEEIEIPELEEINYVGEDDISGEIDGEDDIPDNIVPICKTGDLWILGKHRLLCGDATKKEDIEQLMDGKKADMVFTDPPYGMNLVKNSGVLKHYRDVKNDDGNETAIMSFNLLNNSKFINNDAKMIWFGANYYANALPNSSCWFVWDKNNGNSDQMDCELAWTNIGGVTRKFTQASEKTNRIHPTQKPVSLFVWGLKKVNAKSVIDLFVGSGTSIIACEECGRKCYGMEIDERYCDLILERYLQFTGNSPVREDGKKYIDLKIEQNEV